MYLTFWKRPQYRDRKHISECQGTRCRKGLTITGQHGRIFVMDLFCIMTAVMNIQLYAFVKTHKTQRLKFAICKFKQTNRQTRMWGQPEKEYIL